MAPVGTTVRQLVELVFNLDPQLPQVQDSLDLHPRLVLEAPPGAGKTTQVPLALLHARWLDGQKIIVVSNHFNSKGGDQPLFGPNQAPVLSSAAQRLQQAQGHAGAHERLERQARLGADAIDFGAQGQGRVHGRR